ncbi:Hypp7927 [Branchiostoma lanceolatum]|nr:Hypp7927 [Branchiostoma lanceolatum]
MQVERPLQMRKQCTFMRLILNPSSGPNLSLSGLEKIRRDATAFFGSLMPRDSMVISFALNMVHNVIDTCILSQTASTPIEREVLERMRERSANGFLKVVACTRRQSPNDGQSDDGVAAVEDGRRIINIIIEEGRQPNDREQGVFNRIRRFIWSKDRATWQNVAVVGGIAVLTCAALYGVLYAAGVVGGSCAAAEAAAAAAEAAETAAMIPEAAAAAAEVAECAPAVAEAGAAIVSAQPEIQVVQNGLININVIIGAISAFFTRAHRN